MSSPSFSNIDLWLFELAEGNLSPAQVAQLESFLLQYPELDVDRDLWEMSSVKAAPVVYPNQGALGRGKSKRRFALIGISALLFLTCSVGVIKYFTSEPYGKLPNGTTHTASNNFDQNTQEQILLSEIEDLKSTIASLENKISSSQVSRISEVLNDDFTNSFSISNGTEESASSGSERGIEIAEVFNEQNQGGGIDQVEPSAFESSTTNSTLASNNQVSSSMIAINDNRNSNISIAAATINPAGPSLNTNEPVISVNEPMLSLNEFKALPEARILLTKKIEKQLETYELTHVETPDDAIVNTVRTRSKSEWQGMGVADYNNSLKHRMARFGRNFQRMMDNPIALKNSRDPHYHVPGKSSQDLNFGSVGTLIAPRVQTMSRLQWYGEANEQFSNQLSIDGYSYALRGGLGMQLNHSIYNRGGLQVSDATFTYSPKISVNRKISIEPSFRFKMGGKFLNDQSMGDASQVEFDRGNVHNYYNDSTAPIGKSLWYKDLGVGLNVNTKWFFISAQVDNIFNHRDNVYSSNLVDPRRAGTQFVTTIGTDLDSRDENMTFSPYMVYQKNEQLSEAWLGFNYRFEWFTIGGAVSSNLEPAASIGVKFKHFSMHVNSDYTYSLMTNKKALSHQVTLRFLGKPNRFGKRLLNL